MENLQRINFETVLSEQIGADYYENDIIMLKDAAEIPVLLDAHLEGNLIVLCENGNATVYVNGEERQIHENQIFISRPNVVLSDFETSDDFKFSVILISDRLLASSLKDNITIWSNALYVQNANVFDFESRLFEIKTASEKLIQFILCDRDSPFYKEKLFSMLNTFMLQICEQILRNNGSRNMLSTT